VTTSTFCDIIQHNLDHHPLEVLSYTKEWLCDLTGQNNKLNKTFNLIPTSVITSHTILAIEEDKKVVLEAHILDKNQNEEQPQKKESISSIIHEPPAKIPKIVSHNQEDLPTRQPEGQLDYNPETISKALVLLFPNLFPNFLFSMFFPKIVFFPNFSFYLNFFNFI
jgi:hypothetical protein